MVIRVNSSLFSLFLALAFLLTFSNSATAQTESITRAPRFSAEQLLSSPTDGWMTNGGNLFNQRFSPLTQITTANVNRLKGVWRVRLGSGLEAKYSGEAQPLIYGGVIYIVTGADDVSAVAVETGKILWQYQANLDQSIDTVCCGWTSRGLALGDGKIYVGQLDGRLVALDQITGKIVWSSQVGRWEEGYTITSAPLYYDGLVITGTAGGDRGVRGHVTAYAAETGQLVWRFYTIPGIGEWGHDTWPSDNDAWKYGGAAVWQTPAVDPDLGLIYFSTSNPGPDFNGAIRAGDNLFSSAIVALDVKTGERRWHFQQVRHDLWDYDAPNPVVLFNVEVHGTLRKALAQAGKTGWVYILDRTNGEPLLGIEDKEVPQEPRQKTAATQPFPKGDAFVPQMITETIEGVTLINEGRIFTPYWKDGVLARPSTFGGANWPPSSYDPSTQRLHICANDRIAVFKGGDEVELPPDPAVSFIGGHFGTAEYQPQTRGIFAVIDLTNNRLVWQQKWTDLCYSGSVTTAGGLIFVGRSDGRFLALNARNGAWLWEFQTGAGVNAPASVFEYNGQQYVTVLSAGNLFGRGPRGDSLWLFSLTGTLDPVEPATSMN
ncbi:MAG: PQQ-binding-like beta-propeller repeat protein [Acidobacteriota bacterium]|nr:PQQ-binding-like beta-propeller repeat protein [Acidobacteriota bacterium]